MAKHSDHYRLVAMGFLVSISMIQLVLLFGCEVQCRHHHVVGPIQEDYQSHRRLLENNIDSEESKTVHCEQDLVISFYAPSKLH